MFDVIKFKKFLEKKKKQKKKQWCKGPKTDEKVASLNVEVHAKTFAYQIFVFFNGTVC